MSENSNLNEPTTPVNILNKSTDAPKQGHYKPPRKYPKEDLVIHHMYQLTTLEKQKVKNLFREAYIKGFRMDQIPEFIYIKSKLNVTYGLVCSLKEQQKIDDGYWFYELARDSTAYLSCYRLAIDKLDQLEKEMWLLIMNPKVETSVRVMATKEIHSIIKTGVLLLRDLPFITNLSKFYDLSELDPDKKGLKKLQYVKDRNNPNSYDPLKKEFNKSDFDGLNSSLVHNIIHNITDKKRIDNVDADVIEEMQSQIQTLGYDTDPDILEKKEAHRKSIEDKYIEQNLATLDKELSNVKSEDESKVIKAAQDYRKTMDYLDQIVSPEHRDAITRIRSITEDKQ